MNIFMRLFLPKLATNRQIQPFTTWPRLTGPVKSWPGTSSKYLTPSHIEHHWTTGLTEPGNFGNFRVHFFELFILTLAPAKNACRYSHVCTCIGFSSLFPWCPLLLRKPPVFLSAVWAAEHFVCNFALLGSVANSVPLPLPLNTFSDIKNYPFLWIFEDVETSIRELLVSKK